MLRTAFFFTTVVVATIFYGAPLIVAGLLRVPPTPGGIFDRVSRRWARVLLWAAGTPVAIRGLEHIPPTPVLFVANHASMFDILALAANFPRTVRFVAKKELLKVPFFGPAMKAAGHVTIDRQQRQAAFASYDRAAALIARGLSAGVFPEGTRSRTGDLQAFKKGPFVLAIAAQVPIVPIYVGNTFDILPKGGRALRPRTIPIRYGPPIPTNGLDYEDRGTLMERTHAAMLELKVLVDAEFGGH
jgi:1-acyl-sn-glycerol-3-phosphate acyltransferase